jgi:ribosomal protein S18 acetylase RimI-like enzyme
LRSQDLPEVKRIDTLHTGFPWKAYWDLVFHRFVETGAGATRIALAGEADLGLAGYLLGEVRAFEFGSEACGWIFAMGVDPRVARGRVGSLLLAEACARFHDAGVPCVRTMVRRNDVPVLSFFRANGFRGGPFVQLELDLEELREGVGEAPLSDERREREDGPP